MIFWVRIQDLGWGEEHTCNAHSRCLAVTSCVPSLRHKRAAEVVLRSYVADEGQVWKLSRSIGTVIGVDRYAVGSRGVQTEIITIITM